MVAYDISALMEYKDYHRECRQGSNSKKLTKLGGDGGIGYRQKGTSVYQHCCYV
jgi:hypothetical protein